MPNSVTVTKQHRDSAIEIKVEIDSDGLYLTTTLDEYLEHLAAHMGNPAFLLTQNQLLAKMKKESANVVQVMKEASIHNPPPPDYMQL